MLGCTSKSIIEALLITVISGQNITESYNGM